MSCPSLDNLYFRLLLHTETPDGSVIPVWEEVRPGDVAVMKDVMSACQASYNDIDISYRRVPITAERPPDFSDYSELITVMLSPNMTHTPIVVNDQLGRGRSTLTTVGVNRDERLPHICLRRGYLRSFLFFCNSGLRLCHQVLESANADRQFWDILTRNLAILLFGDNRIQSSTVCAVVKNVIIPVLTISQIYYVSFAKALRSRQQWMML